MNVLATAIKGNGFNLRGDDASIKEASRLVYFEAARRIPPVSVNTVESGGTRPAAVDDGRDTRAPMTEAQARDIWQQTSAEVAKMELEGRYYFASWALITIRLTEKFHGIAPPGAIDAAIAKEKQA